MLLLLVVEHLDRSTVVWAGNTDGLYDALDAVARDAARADETTAETHFDETGDALALLREVAMADRTDQMSSRALHKPWGTDSKKDTYIYI